MVDCTNSEGGNKQVPSTKDPKASIDEHISEGAMRPEERKAKMQTCSELSLNIVGAVLLFEEGTQLQTVEGTSQITCAIDVHRY